MNRSFFAELKRRNVYKVAVAYAVAGWLVIQIGLTVLPTFHTPEWLAQTLVVLVALGFPIAVVLAWAFELTPGGIKRTEDAEEAQSIPRSRGWIYITAIGAALSIGLFFLGRFSVPLATRNSAREATQKSIAVLPFESLSEEKSNAYFADGIQDEVLTRLAQIADLKVISRTSTQKYKSAPGNLREIAQQLGVAHILEGSVQKANDQVRVTVQLINATNDAHVWAHTYDRKLTDIFGVESEIAKSIAESLQAKLAGREEQALAVKPTKNPEAYDAYLRGLAAEGQELHDLYALEKAAGFYERAVQLDPAFAVAWSRLARVESDFFSPTLAQRDAAKHALEMAQTLQPDAPETLFALGVHQYRTLNDYEGAKITFRRIATVLPGSSDAPTYLARIARRQARWDESVSLFEQALVLDPRNVELLDQAAANYTDLRQFDAARKLYDRALDILPNDPDLMAYKAVGYQAEGNLTEAGKLLRNVTAQISSIGPVQIKANQFTLEHNEAAAVGLWLTRVREFHAGSEGERGVSLAFLALAQRLTGDIAGARVNAEEARQTLVPVCQQQPENDFLAIFLSRAYAVLGDKDSALKEAQRAIDALPTASEPYLRPTLNENIAFIQTVFGEKSAAISTLERLFKLAYFSHTYGVPITPALLRLDRTWDPLRSEPAFQKLCEEKKP